MATDLTPACTRFHSVQKLSNDDLAQQLKQLVTRKHVLDAELLLYLSELERRGLYRNQACPSLFEFCVTRLGFSEDVAYKRVGVARMLRQFPLVFELLSEGRIHLTALMLLKPHLTEENHRDWLLAACAKSKRQIEKLVATRCPSPEVPAQVRKLPQPATRSVGQIVAGDADTSCQVPTTVVLPDASALPVATALPTASSATRIQPLSARSYRVVFTAPEALKQKLDRARELASHAVSPSDLPALIERAFDLLIDHEERRRFATSPRRKTTAKHQPCQKCHPNPEGLQDPDPVDSLDACRMAPEAPSGSDPQPGSTSKRSRYVPAAVRRAVLKRDAGQCTFEDEAGHRCSERRFLEIEHCIPHALGGSASIANLRILCRAHNALQAEAVFGRRN